MCHYAESIMGYNNLQTQMIDEETGYWKYIRDLKNE